MQEYFDWRTEVRLCEIRVGNFRRFSARLKILLRTRSRKAQIHIQYSVLEVRLLRLTAQSGIARYCLRQT
jgi:BMFP domain-containing protein YqiC